MNNEKKYQCCYCGTFVSEDYFVFGANTCVQCNDQGIWIDPAGGIHHNGNDEDYDPAKMYE